MVNDLKTISDLVYKWELRYGHRLWRRQLWWSAVNMLLVIGVDMVMG